jgi:hypothetical protein
LARLRQVHPAKSQLSSNSAHERSSSRGLCTIG